MYKLYETKMQYNMPFLATLVQKSKQIQPKTEIFHFSKISVFGIFMGGFQVKSAFWWQFNNKIDHNKCTPLKKNMKFCIFGKSQFHQIQPTHKANITRKILTDIVRSELIHTSCRSESSNCGLVILDKYYMFCSRT